jgi:hypothetical protein
MDIPKTHQSSLSSGTSSWVVRSCTPIHLARQHPRSQVWGDTREGISIPLALTALCFLFLSLSLSLFVSLAVSQFSCGARLVTLSVQIGRFVLNCHESTWVGLWSALCLCIFELLQLQFPPALQLALEKRVGGPRTQFCTELYWNNSCKSHHWFA